MLLGSGWCRKQCLGYAMVAPNSGLAHVTTLSFSPLQLIMHCSGKHLGRQNRIFNDRWVWTHSEFDGIKLRQTLPFHFIRIEVTGRVILGDVRLRLELHFDLGWTGNARPTVPGGKSFNRRRKHGCNKTNCGRRDSG